MKLPKSISEKLLYSTIRLEIENSKATGFIFDYIGDNSNPVIVTNKHVIDQMINSKEMKFHLHFVTEGQISSQNLEVVLQTTWNEHKEHDLVSCELKPILEYVRAQGITPYYQSITVSHVPDQVQLDSLNALEEVVMIGYPNGLWDEANNLPLIRKGFTASHPAYDFKNSQQGLSLNGYGVIDIAAFPGSSGSPIFILNESGYYDKNLGKFVNDGTRLIFLGILFKGPLFIQQSINQDHTPILMNLGYYIKSYKLFDLFQKM